jgi:acetolactate synthase I/II/III large subunit
MSNASTPSVPDSLTIALTGADALVRTLADCGVSACFANPGTSEMHLVQALDREPRIRSVLCLFEGVATGAADGWARMSGVPAMTLLHLGPGYANGAANIHNARRAYAPMVNVVGDHATHHRTLDAPLSSDIETLVRPNSRWVGVVERAIDAGDLAATAFQQAMGPPGAPVSLILPADSAWTEGGMTGHVLPRPEPSLVDSGAIEDVVDAIGRATKPVLLVGGPALADDGALAVMARLKAAGLRVMADTFPARLARGAGRFAPDRMVYFAEMAMADLEGTDLMVLAGTSVPCAFFAYPGKPSVLVPEGCKTLELSLRHEDTIEVLSRLAEALGAPEAGSLPARARPAAPTGALNPHACAQSLARHLPDNAIISDDAVTAGLPHYVATANAAPHDWLFLTGGAIGQGLPLAVGAAIAEPTRKVVALTGDGAGMYTLQALWTMARERLPIVTIVFANRSYRILTIEMARTEAGNPGPAARSMLSLDNPPLDWVALAKGHGVDAVRCTNAEDFDVALERAMGADGPVLIEAVF